jgi:hypothetical protein
MYEMINLFRNPQHQVRKVQKQKRRKKKKSGRKKKKVIIIDFNLCVTPYTEKRHKFYKK